MVIRCYLEAKRKYYFCLCPSQLIFFFKRIQKLFGWKINTFHHKCIIMSMICLYFEWKLMSRTPRFTLHSMLQCEDGVHNDITRKTWLPHSSEDLNGIWVAFASFVTLYRCQNMFVSGKELNNDELGHNKRMISGRILLGWVLGGRVGRLTRNLNFFYFANTSQSNLSSHLPWSNCVMTPPSLDQIIH